MTHAQNLKLLGISKEQFNNAVIEIAKTQKAIAEEKKNNLKK